jgi:membrane protein DedA with SNARE-associated domain
VPEASPFINHFPYLGIFVLLILGEIGFPFPEDATLILSGVLTAHGVTKPLPAFFVVYFGLLLMDLLLYAVGKKYGRSIVEHRGFVKSFPPINFLNWKRNSGNGVVWWFFLGDMSGDSGPRFSSLPG